MSWRAAACTCKDTQRFKSLAEFAARRRQKIQIIFSCDMCARENTAQAASVEFFRKSAKLCAQQTASLLSEKSKGFFDSSWPVPVRAAGQIR